MNNSLFLYIYIKYHFKNLYPMLNHPAKILKTKKDILVMIHDFLDFREIFMKFPIFKFFFYFRVSNFSLSSKIIISSIKELFKMVENGFLDLRDFSGISRGD